MTWTVEVHGERHKKGAPPLSQLLSFTAADVVNLSWAPEGTTLPSFGQEAGTQYWALRSDLIARKGNIVGWEDRFYDLEPTT